jgi:hypothetical protein
VDEQTQVWKMVLDLADGNRPEKDFFSIEDCRTLIELYGKTTDFPLFMRDEIRAKMPKLKRNLAFFRFCCVVWNMVNASACCRLELYGTKKIGIALCSLIDQGWYARVHDACNLPDAVFDRRYGKHV